MLKHGIKNREMPTVRLLMWTAIVVVLLTMIGAVQPFEDQLRMLRNYVHPHKASGDIVLISIDDRALHDMGRWPWPRRYHAQLIDRLTTAGVKQIYSDITFETRSDPADDNALADAIKRSGRVTLPVRGRSGPYVIGQQSRANVRMKCDDDE